MGSNERGFTYPELLTTMAIWSLVLLITLPAAFSIMRRFKLRAAAGRMQGVLAEAREYALTSDNNCGVKFSLIDGRWHYALYEDGNGNGILNKDIASGVDRLVSGPTPVADAPVEVAIAPGMRDYDTNKPIPEAAQPVNFNNSTLCVFASSGSSTPGSLYLTAGAHYAAMVRSSGQSGRIRVAFYDYSRKGWEDCIFGCG